MKQKLSVIWNTYKGLEWPAKALLWAFVVITYTALVRAV